MTSYINPLSLRSLGDHCHMIYSTVIISYLDYMRQFDYTSTYLWVSPPTAGIDYIFNRHPAGQAILRFARSRSWYESLTAYGTKQGVESFVRLRLDRADDKHNPTSGNLPKSSQQNDDRLVCGGCRECRNSTGGGCKYYRKHDGLF
ncbi:unnamed protein product [Didymodactylos carnosus]|uniref:histone acetyltransferase n=1 Tax=Didymodactylos carnosus TaxID=1234261 RepID=A0A815CNL9_9BILA|nr:unnamed protein product [Didymodactylos carnosus]CAF1427186.1 unnamed protein product [Didymodactylos carnosus]CAF4095199.1 unnamed protein product [Didymodactylos carnosus]CAF4226079.1 unnamed protein product [Didymodactylos carnosus]